MKLYLGIFFILLIVGFYSCSVDEINVEPVAREIASKAPDAIVSTTDTIQIVDTIVEFEPVELSEEQARLKTDSLDVFLPDSLVQIILDGMAERKAICTQDELYHYYKITLSSIQGVVLEGMDSTNPDVIYSGDNEPALAWTFINKFIPELYPDCPCSECGSEAHILLSKMEELAKATPGDEDDRFFHLKLQVYGEEWENKEDSDMFMMLYDNFFSGFYIVDHCDICSYESLGNDFHYHTFKYILDNEWSLYQDEVTSIMNQGTFGNYTRNFYYDKPLVMLELEKLQKLNLPENHKDGIKQILEKIEANEDVFFGCQNFENDCPVG